MKARIYFTLGDYDDIIDLSGDLEEIREKVEVELAQRNAVYSHSEILEE